MCVRVWNCRIELRTQNSDGVRHETAAKPATKITYSQEIVLHRTKYRCMRTSFFLLFSQLNSKAESICTQKLRPSIKIQKKIRKKYRKNTEKLKNFLYFFL